MFNKTILFYGLLACITIWFLLFYLVTNDDVVIVLSSSVGAESLEDSPAGNRPTLPKIFDINLKTEVIFQGLNFPTSLAFLGPDDILVLEKNTGKVIRIVNGSLIQDSLLDANVSTESERGLLGIAVEKNENKEGSMKNAVFLYFTESRRSVDGDLECLSPEVYNCKQRPEPLGNRLYKYEVMNNKLTNPKLLLDLPATPGPNHNGGSITIGPDKNVYITIGDLNVLQNETYFTRTENVGNGRNPDGRAGILRITQDGEPLSNDSPIGDKYPLDLYYAYGIRNSFGMDFDPLTGNLWDTENGPGFGDEINLVEPGFNSGWNKVQGIRENSSTAEQFMSAQERDILVDFDGQGKYSNPEFTWIHSVGLTALRFLDSEIYGEKYENDMFVGDFHNGKVYHFDLVKNRTAFELSGSLKDNISNSQEELKTTLFGQGFGGVTDIEIGPDGYLYVLSVSQGGDDCTRSVVTTTVQPESSNPPCIFYNSQLQGSIFRVVPETVSSSSEGIGN